MLILKDIASLIREPVAATMLPKVHAEIEKEELNGCVVHVRNGLAWPVIRLLYSGY